MKVNLADRVSQVEEYYFSRKLKEIAQMRLKGQDIINLGIGSPDLSPATNIIQRLCEEAKQENQHGYQPYMGIPEFRQAISDWYQRKLNVTLNPDSEILPLIGSKEGIMHISMTYLQTGDQVLVPDPGYPSYKSTGLLSGAEIITYDLTEDSSWLPQLDKLENQDLSRVKIMWLNYPHMPTGAVASFSFFEKLVKFAHRHNILLCHDNPYAFILNDRPLSILEIDGAKDVAIELSSFSKTFNMAGWRIGFMGGHADRITEILRFKTNMDSGMFKPMQLAAIEALHQPDSWYTSMNETYRRRRVHAEAILSSLGCTFDRNQVGMFVWGRIPNHIEDGIALADQILNEARVFLAPGNIFGKNGNRYIRISLCTKDSIFEQALDRINVYLSSLKTSI